MGKRCDETFHPTRYKNAKKKCMKICSLSLAIREIHIKTTMR